MAWSWMVVGSGWTSPSQSDRTPRPLESTWAGPHTEGGEAAVEVVPAVQALLGAIHVTMTADMTADPTEDTTVDPTEDTTVDLTEVAMTTGTTSAHTEGDLRPRTTEGITRLGPDRALILPDATKCCCQAPPPPTQTGNI